MNDPVASQRFGKILRKGLLVYAHKSGPPSHRADQGEEMRFTGILLFAKSMKTMTSFYRDGLGLKVAEKQHFPPNKLIHFDDGFALHSAGTPTGSKNKLQFEAESLQEVHERLRAWGKKMKRLQPFEGVGLLNLKDPEGNRFQVTGPY